MVVGSKRDCFPENSGYSLIEIIMVLTLWGILLAIAIPDWGSLRPTFQLRSSVRQVQSELHKIKMQAAAENTGFQIVYAEGSAAYTIQRDQKPLLSKPLPEGIVITKAGTISFSPRGTAGADRVRLRNIKGACTQVVVSPTGRIRVCNPSGCREDC